MAVLQSHTRHRRLFNTVSFRSVVVEVCVASRLPTVIIPVNVKVNGFETVVPAFGSETCRLVRFGNSAWAHFRAKFSVQRV